MPDYRSFTSRRKFPVVSFLQWLASYSTAYSFHNNTVSQRILQWTINDRTYVSLPTDFGQGKIYFSN
jgi:hypothetical protein